MSPEGIAAVVATLPALVVLVRLFAWKRGLIYSLYAAGLTWVIVFSLAYIVLGSIFGGLVHR